MALRLNLFRNISVLILVVLGIATTLLVGCENGSNGAGKNESACGTGQFTSEANGLFWILGTPTTANILCSVQSNELKLVQTLNPESRDPLLLHDSATGQTLLVERFSGRTARPTRATWYSSSGEVLTQRGDWPQNVYNVMRISQAHGVVTGFDFADLRKFIWSGSEVSVTGNSESTIQPLGKFNPILTLKNGEWFAAIDGGYDLIKFNAKDAKALVFREGGSAGSVVEKTVSDSSHGMTCKNAFQTVALNNSKAILSCNPQYFGPLAGEFVTLFEVELTAQGNFNARKLLSRVSDDIQRIDLWGINSKADEVFVGFKKTTPDDYQGKVVESGWVSLADGRYAVDNRFQGPVRALASGGFIYACQSNSEACRVGDVAVVDENRSQAKIQSPEFSLPFFSFATSVPAP